MLLHVPKNLKASWGVLKDYIVFVGQQSGCVVNREIFFEPDLVYPWLDNQSFNKWFQADGTDRPFGNLSIAEADQVDFRIKSLTKLFTFLTEKHYLTSAAQQMQFGLERSANFIFCGYTCAGKTTASQNLARKFGYLHVEASDFMYLSYYYRHGFKGDISIGDFAEKALAQKVDIASDKAAEYIAENLSVPIVISGFRAPEEITTLNKTLNLRGKLFKTFFVYADEEDRFARFQRRRRPGDGITREEFRRRDSQQERMGLSEIKVLKDIAEITNRNSLADYIEQIDHLVSALPLDEIEISPAIDKLGTIADVKLEDAILVALLSAWKEDENRPFFSSTKICSMINSTFKNIVPKHKDNVSRYFNQDYYAYYEISQLRAKMTRVYRLSNTGYGKAVSTLRKLSRLQTRDSS